MASKNRACSASVQGLTLVLFTAKRKRLMRDRGYVQGLSRRVCRVCKGVSGGYLGCVLR